MKTVTVSARSRTLNKLMKMAEHGELILQSTSGEQYLLARVTGTESFYVGDSDDFDEEIAATRKNKRLMKFLDERCAKAKGEKGIPIEEVRRQLGLQKPRVQGRSGS
jgi:hypothetical protein